jgi:hypothetical protein
MSRIVKADLAAPQIKRMLVVSTWMYCCSGCLRPLWGGTLAMVPSNIFNTPEDRQRKDYIMSWVKEVVANTCHALGNADPVEDEESVRVRMGLASWARFVVDEQRGRLRLDEERGTHIIKGQEFDLNEDRPDLEDAIREFVRAQLTVLERAIAARARKGRP